jgi:hypothetical protein
MFGSLQIHPRVCERGLQELLLSEAILKAPELFRKILHGLAVAFVLGEQK